MSENKMTVVDVTRLIDSLQYRSQNMWDLAGGVRNGAHGHARFIELTPNLISRIRKLSEDQASLRTQLEKAIEKIEVEINI